MGTDRHLMWEGACPCGKGTLRVDHCEKDHPYATVEDQWYEGSVHCATCGPKYELRGRRSFGLFDRRITARNEAASREAWDRRNKVLAGEKAQGYFKQLATLLDKPSSGAALHRLLKEAGFYVPNVQKFRDRWRGGEDWVRHERPDMEKVLMLLNVKDAALLDELAKAGAYAAEPDSMVGAPVYTLPKDA
jgi:hypothetical protein